MKKAKTKIDEMRVEYSREDLGPLVRGKYSAAYKKSKHGTTHVTPADGNIFLELGHDPETAAKMLEECDRNIAEKLAAKGKRTPLTRSFRVTIRDRLARDPEFARALRAEAAMLKDDSTAGKRKRQTRKVAHKK